MGENEQRLIGEFDKNALELVRVHLSKWKTQDYCDIRIWVKPEPNEPGGEIATRKGITLSAELLPDLIKALQEAQAALEGPGVERRENGQS